MFSEWETSNGIHFATDLFAAFAILIWKMRRKSQNEQNVYIRISCNAHRPIPALRLPSSFHLHIRNRCCARRLELQRVLLHSLRHRCYYTNSRKLKTFIYGKWIRTERTNIRALVRMHLQFVCMRNRNKRFFCVLSFARRRHRMKCNQTAATATTTTKIVSRKIKRDNNNNITNEPYGDWTLA